MRWAVATRHRSAGACARSRISASTGTSGLWSWAGNDFALARRELCHLRSSCSTPPAGGGRRRRCPVITPEKRLSSPFGGDFAVAATRNPCYQPTSRPQLRHHELHTPRASSVPLCAQLARTAAAGRPRSTSTARVFSSKRHRNAHQKAGQRRGAEKVVDPPRSRRVNAGRTASAYDALRASPPSRANHP